MNLISNYSLLSHNTFGIDVRCRMFAEYDSPEELYNLLTSPQREALNILHIGGGSNLLFLHDFDGLVLHSNIKDIECIATEDDHVWVRVGAAVVWDDFVRYALDHGWYGLENLSLIPGEVGASAVQNIGAYGREAKDFITEVECMNLHTGEPRTFTNEECRYSYRQSLFKTPEERGRWAVLHVTYRLSTTFKPSLDYGGIRNELQRQQIDIDNLKPNQLRDTIIGIRRTKLPDPKEQGNAGSFFMNPIVPRQEYEALASLYPGMPHYDVGADQVKIPAGWMIEQCGWKGRALGPAAVHDRQALVLVNRGGATGQDIVALSDAVRHDVLTRFGIDIHPEVNFISTNIND